MSKNQSAWGGILMEIMSADDRLLFRLRARNQGIAGALFAAGHIAVRATGSAGWTGASHG
jgi:hypothetical protein